MQSAAHELSQSSIPRQRVDALGPRSPLVKGDVNCDHAVNTDDIPYFVGALIGEDTGSDFALADMNGDGAQDGADIQLLSTPCWGDDAFDPDSATDSLRGNNAINRQGAQAPSGPRPSSSPTTLIAPIASN